MKRSSSVIGIQAQSDPEVSNDDKGPDLVCDGWFWCLHEVPRPYRVANREPTSQVFHRFSQRSYGKVLVGAPMAFWKAYALP